jgi:hypothetical protein
MRWDSRTVEVCTSQRELQLKKLLHFYFCTQLLSKQCRHDYYAFETNLNNSKKIVKKLNASNSMSFLLFSVCVKDFLFFVRWIHCHHFSEIVSSFALEYSEAESMSAGCKIHSVENVVLGVVPRGDANFKAGSYLQFNVILSPAVYKFFPCRAPRQDCVVLPALSNAACQGFVSEGASVLAGLDELRDYWRVVHGYHLPPSALTKFLSVHFNGCGNYFFIHKQFKV